MKLKFLFSVLILLNSFLITHAKYKVVKYNISVLLPESYDKLKINSELSIQNDLGYNKLIIRLCHEFKGAKYEIIEVTDEKSGKLSYQIKNREIEIRLPETLQNKKNFKLNINYILYPDPDYPGSQFDDFSFMISKNQTHINAANTRTDNWYPKIKDKLVTVLPEFTLSIEVPYHLEVMASGKLKFAKIINSHKRFVYTNYKGVTDRSLFFFIHNLKKQVVTYPDGFKIEAYIPNDTFPGNLKYVTDVIYNSYQYFSEVLGESPGNEFKFSTFDYGYSGLFNAITIPTSLITKQINNNDIYFPIRSVIHEVSHTWWGNIVTADHNKNYWMFESFAKYFEIVALDDVLGIDNNIVLESFKRLKTTTAAYINYALPMNKSQEETNRQLQAVSGYYSGALLLNNIAFILGKEQFLKALKEYVSYSKGRIVNSDEFINIMQKYSKQEITNLFNGYLKNQGFFEYLLTLSNTVENGDSLILTYKIQNTGEMDFIVPVTIESDIRKEYIILELNAGVSQSITVKSQQNNFGFNYITVDPDGIFPIKEKGKTGPGGILFEINNQVRIFNIARGTPMSIAGFQSGEILISINGESIENKTFYELNELMQQPAGTEIVLEILNDKGLKHELTVNYHK